MRGEQARQSFEQHQVITLNESAFGEFMAELNGLENRPMPPFAEEIIGEYGAWVRDEVTLDSSSS